MATYITLLNFTQKGVENIKDGPTRLDQAKKMFSSKGAEIKEFYLRLSRVEDFRLEKRYQA